MAEEPNQGHHLQEEIHKLLVRMSSSVPCKRHFKQTALIVMTSFKQGRITHVQSQEIL